MANESDIDALFALAEERYGQITGLVNNDGIRFNAVAWLMSKEASYVTGAILRVAGASGPVQRSRRANRNPAAHSIVNTPSATEASPMSMPPLGT